MDITCVGPFDLRLSLKAVGSFGRATAATALQSPGDLVAAAEILRLGVRIGGRATLIEVRQIRADPAVLRAVSRPASPLPLVRSLVERVVNASLDLRPFYRLVAEHARLGPISRALRGLKPFRPASMLDMLVSAITEQQISLAAAHHIRDRLVERFGDAVEGLPVFPAAETLAVASLQDLTACGLSRRKAEYVLGVAQAVASGGLDLGALETAPTENVRERLLGLRGFGPWSADYILVRGLGRADVVPVDDLGVRTVLGKILGDGHRLTPVEVTDMLAPFVPYRGLATFYALVATRLATLVQPSTGSAI